MEYDDTGFSAVVNNIINLTDIHQSIVILGGVFLRELLDSSTQRRLSILETLNEHGGWISSNELAKRNSASLRTINSDVNYLKDHWYPHLLIETSKKNGIRLQTQPSSHVGLVYNYIMKHSEAFQFLEEVFFNPTLSIERWGEKLFISESSLYRITNQMARSLGRYGLTLLKKPCNISGDNEAYVRFFYANYFFEKCGMMEWPFAIEKKLVFNYVKQVLTDRNIFTNDESKIMYFCYLVSVSLVRISQNFLLTTDTLPEDDCSTKQEILEQNNYLDPMLAVYAIGKNESVMKDLSFFSFFYEGIWDSDEEKHIVEQEIHTLIKSVRDAFDIKLTHLDLYTIETNLAYLYTHRKVYPFADFILFDKFLYNGKAIRHNYPDLAHVVYQSLKKIQKNTKFPWYSDYRDEVLYLLMTKWQDMPNILDNRKEKARLLVLSDLGIDHERLLVKLIKKNFDSKIHISSYTNSVIFLDETSETDFQHYDILVTTFIANTLPEEKIVVVDDIPSDQDWGNLRKAINAVRKLTPNDINQLH